MSNTEIVLQTMLTDSEKKWKIEELVAATGIDSGALRKALFDLKERRLVAPVEQGAYVLTFEAKEQHKRKLKLEREQEERRENDPLDEENPKSAVSKLTNYFREVIYKDFMESVSQMKPLYLDYDELERFDVRVADLIHDNYWTFERAVDMAVDNIDKGDVENRKRKLEVIVKNTRCPNVMIRNIRSIHIKKYIQICGRIRSANAVKPNISAATFECLLCGERITLLEEEKYLKKPAACECGNNRGFEMVSRKLLDMQRISIEEDTDGITGDIQARRIDVILGNHMINEAFQQKVILGSKVAVFGVLQDEAKTDSRGRVELERRVFLSARELIMLDDTQNTPPTDEEIAKIKELARSPDIFEKLVRSYAPRIEGHTNIKEGTMLSLFGGVRKDGENPCRGDIHEIIIGDPSGGKTVLLKEAEKIAPKSRFAVGKTSSGVGLTCSVQKDERSGCFELVAGVIPMASGGIAIIDEFEKMGEDEDEYLLEAMESQEVDVAKAGIQATLKARTTIIAAANPKFGKFDNQRDIFSQISLKPFILSRFDLIYIFRDTPDKHKDAAIAGRIFDVHSGNREAVKPEIESDLMRKYIAYARQTCFPILPIELRSVYTEFYVEMRKKFGERGNGAPLAARQYEALIRLSEASARTRLAEHVEMQDFERAKKVLLDCLGQFNDIDLLEAGMGTEKRQKYKAILEAIKKLSGNNERLASEMDLNAFLGFDPKKELAELSYKGEIYSPRPNFWSIN